MRLLRILHNRFRSLLLRSRAEVEMQREMEIHIEELTKEYIAAGMSEPEARLAARREFGSPEIAMEQCRDTRRVSLIADFGKDLVYAWRVLKRSPGFTLIAVLSLALGIGANTAIFSLFNAVMLRPMAVKQPDQLVQLFEVSPDGLDRSALDRSEFEYVRDNTESFAGVLAQAGGGSSKKLIDIRGVEDTPTFTFVSGSYHSVLGLQPVVGRMLTPADEHSPVAVIGYRYWQRRFGLDPAVAGQTFALNGRVFTILGVTPPEFFGTHQGSDPDITLPLSMMKYAIDGRLGNPPSSVMARLKPDVSIHQGTAELNRVYGAWLSEQARPYPNAKARERALSRRMEIRPAFQGFGGLHKRFSEPLKILLAMVCLLLLLACVNLSSLLLARATGRQREISIRTSIGASRGRLIRQFLTESLLLTLLGGAAGSLLASWFIHTLIAMMANGDTLRIPTAPDWRVLAFTALMMLATCVLVGLAPAWHAARSDMNVGLKELPTGGRLRMGRLLVIAQVAISMVLLVAASLFVGTLVKLYTLDAGFRRDGVLAFSLDSKVKPDPAREQTLRSAILISLNTMPGVRSASSSMLLLIGEYGNGSFRVEGTSLPVPRGGFSATFNWVGPRFFETLGTPLLLGREFSERDNATSPKVAIVNDSFSRYFFQGASPLGHRVDDAEIVGVVTDTKQRNLREDFPRTAYFALAQGDQGATSYLVRVAGGNPKKLTPAVEEIVHQADPEMRLSRVRTLTEHIDRSLLNERIMAVLTGFFGTLAVLIACLGIFGLLAFQVARRTNEFGIRMALGARPVDILSLVLRNVMVTVTAGLAIGCVAAAQLTSIAKSMLFGLTPTDPAAFLVAAGVLAAAGALAGYLPAKKASRIDPMEALRHE